ncbi:MAG: segregation/condensation protein A [Patescibacteria group bacterium]|nr:segregation/condensation protein A [Patescibacteria group bacterium]
MYKITLEQFEGPLDLLLKLIEEEKLDITTVSLAKVTDQYLAHLETLENIKAEELADFLVVAAKLLLIKSKTLLPILQPEEDEIDLEQQLKIYKEYLEASKGLLRLIRKKRFTYTREVSRAFLEPIFTPPAGLEIEDLRKMMLGIINRLEPLISLPEAVIERTISIQEKIAQIKDFIASQAQTDFRSLLNQAKTRTDIIVTFLALLELIKQETIVVVQKSTFEEITIKTYEEHVSQE